MEKSMFFNSQNGDRKYKAEDYAEYFSSFIGNGIFPNPSTNCQVLSNNDMTIIISKGLAWINGYMYINTGDMNHVIRPADSVLDRIDRIVLRWDKVERKIYSHIKVGSYSSNPQPKPLQRDVDAYELAIADIRIRAGTTTITQANITDTRLNKALCGIVHGVVEQVDTTTLFNQYQSWIANKKDEFNTDLVYYKYMKKDEIEQIQREFQNSFIEWFSGIQDILDENVAGNLLNMIEAIPKVLSGVIEPGNMRVGDLWLREVN